MTKRRTVQRATKKTSAKSAAKLDRDLDFLAIPPKRFRRALDFRGPSTLADLEQRLRDLAIIREFYRTNPAAGPRHGISDPRGAITRLGVRRSHATMKGDPLATWRSSADIRASMKKGDRLDNFGQIWKVIRVTRNKITAARELADPRDPEKVVLVDQRDFHPRDLAHMKHVG